MDELPDDERSEEAIRIALESLSGVSQVRLALIASLRERAASVRGLHLCTPPLLFIWCSVRRAPMEKDISSYPPRCSPERQLVALSRIVTGMFSCFCDPTSAQKLDAEAGRFADADSTLKSINSILLRGVGRLVAAISPIRGKLAPSFVELIEKTDKNILQGTEEATQLLDAAAAEEDAVARALSIRSGATPLSEALDEGSVPAAAREQLAVLDALEDALSATPARRAAESFEVLQDRLMRYVEYDKVVAQVGLQTFTQALPMGAVVPKRVKRSFRL